LYKLKKSLANDLKNPPKGYELVQVRQLMHDAILNMFNNRPEGEPFVFSEAIKTIDALNPGLRKEFHVSLPSLQEKLWKSGAKFARTGFKGRQPRNNPSTSFGAQTLWRSRHRGRG